jgi:DNA replication protein DnaD
MPNNGWFLVHRKLFSHEIGNNPLIVALWVRLIADASYEDKEAWLEGAVIPVKRGQVLTSIKKLARWLGLSRATTNRHLNALQMIHQIDIKKTNKYTLITIQNYNKYQTAEHQTDIKLTSNEHQTDTTNKYKEYKEIKEGGILKLTPNQKEELKKQYPYVDLEKVYTKFQAWQKGEGKSFANVLEKFRVWLIEDNDKNKPRKAIVL